MLKSFLAGCLLLLLTASISRASVLDSNYYDFPYQLSIQGNYAGGPNSTTTLEGTLGFLYQLPETPIRIGVTDLGYASSDIISGTRHALAIAPSIEYAHVFSKDVEAVGGLALPVQIRWGAGLDSYTGLMPEARLGLDLYFIDYLGVGIQGKWSYVITDGYVRSPRVLPSGAVVGSIGLDMKFRFH